MSTHAMLDIETLGTRPGSAILSIGCCTFHLSGDGPIETMQETIAIQSCLDAGLTVDGDTISWWLTQSAGARHAVAGGTSSIELALARLWDFLSPSKQVAGVWSHGAGFDLVLLRAAYRAVRMDVPWSYRQERDTRTLFMLAAPGKPPHDALGLTEHVALDDAVAQAWQVQSCFRKLAAASVAIAELTA